MYTLHPIDVKTASLFVYRARPVMKELLFLHVRRQKISLLCSATQLDIQDHINVVLLQNFTMKLQDTFE